MASTRDKASVGPSPSAISTPLDFLRALFVVGALFYVALEPEPLYVVVTAVAVVAIRWAELPPLFDLAFVLGMAMSGWGEALGLYERWPFFDELVHTVLPVLVTPVVYILVSRLDVLRTLEEPGRPTGIVGIVVVGVGLGLAVATIWEIAEWTADELLGWSLVPSLRDTMVDLVLGGVGAVAGALLLALWSSRGWGTTRYRKSQAHPPAYRVRARP